MTLKLYFHPLSSYCHKTLIALYENETPFEPVIVDLMAEAPRAAFYKLWPGGKFPVLRDEARDRIVPESSIIIEYLAQYFPGTVKLIPDDPDGARQVRFRDRFFDLFIHTHMQKIVGDRLRPKDKRDPFGVDEACGKLHQGLDMLEQFIAGREWAMGDRFTMADCAAAPPLFYVDMVQPFGASHKNVAAYLERLKNRPSYARVLKEAEPYFAMLPKEE